MIEQASIGSSMFFIFSWKSFLSVLILLCTVLFLNLILVNVPGNVVYPWVVPMLFSSHEGVGRAFINYPIRIISLTNLFIMELISLIREHKRRI